MIRSVIILAALFIVGCRGPSQIGVLPSPTEDFLSDAARKELHLPSKEEPTPANATDLKYAASISNDVRQAVETFLEPSKVKCSIVAARPVGAYLLLWVSFWPTVADGGAELIYSVEKRRIVGYFDGGGYRG